VFRLEPELNLKKDFDSDSESKSFLSNNEWLFIVIVKTSKELKLLECLTDREQVDYNPSYNFKLKCRTLQCDYMV